MAVAPQPPQKAKRTSRTKTGQISGIPYNTPKDKDKVDRLEKMIMMRVEGHTNLEISKVMDCTEENVCQRLKPYRAEIENLKKFDENKAAIYDFTQQRLLSSITPEKIQAAGLYETIKSVRDLEEMARKVRGLDSVRSVSIFSLTVKAAHALPVNKEALIEGEVDRVCPGPDGSGVCETLREEVMQGVQGVRLDGRGEDGEDMLLREGAAAGGS